MLSLFLFVQHIATSKGANHPSRSSATRDCVCYHGRVYFILCSWSFFSFSSSSILCGEAPFVVVALENKAAGEEVAAGGAIFVHQGLLRVQLFIL